MSNAIYALIQFTPRTNKGDVRSELQTRAQDKLDSLDSDERADAIRVLRQALGELKSSWINSKPRYDKPSGKLVLKFDEAYIEDRGSLKRFFQFWRADPGADISFTRDSSVARAHIPVEFS